MLQRRKRVKRGLPSADEISAIRFRKFMRDMAAYEKRYQEGVEYDQLLDLFLDSIQALQKDPTSIHIKIVVVHLAFRLHSIDRRFVFDREFEC